MKKAIVILSAFFLLTQGTTMADRAGRGPIDRRMMGYGNIHYGTILSKNLKLKLTVDQAARIRDLDEKYAQEIEPISERLYSKGRELKSEWLRREPDRGRITALHGEVAKLRERMREKMAGHRADVLKVLTPEQQAKVPDVSPGRGFHRQAGFGRQ
jgi:Spy/CpxP family protein refolding chaperone